MGISNILSPVEEHHIKSDCSRLQSETAKHIFLQKLSFPLLTRAVVSNTMAPVSASQPSTTLSSTAHRMLPISATALSLPHTPILHSPSNPLSDTIQTITFGILGVLLAIATLIVTYLQLRHMHRASSTSISVIEMLDHINSKAPIDRLKTSNLLDR
jgi:hypothetical protein